jgi:hypothetical protein
MASLKDYIPSLVSNWFSTQEMVNLMRPCGAGDSGTNGAGIDLTDDYSPTRPIKIVRIDSAGNVGFQTADGSSHLVAANDKDELSRMLITKIYSSTDDNYATTATGIHVFYD